MKANIDYSIYLVTDRDLMSADTIEKAIEESINGGCTLVQLREKTANSLEFFEQARRVKSITDKYNIPLIINDRVDIALAIDAAGVHVGQSDLPAIEVRKIIGKDKILGVSASNLTQAQKAEQDSADYIGVGAMFSTNTKEDAKVTSINTLEQICRTVKIPVVAIGGMNMKTIPLFKGIDIQGVAVVSAILAQQDIEKATKIIKKCFLENTVSL